MKTESLKSLEEICVELFFLMKRGENDAYTVRQMLDVLRFHFPKHPALPDSAEMIARDKKIRDEEVAMWRRQLEGMEAYNKAKYEERTAFDIQEAQELAHKPIRWYVRWYLGMKGNL